MISYFVNQVRGKVAGTGTLLALHWADVGDINIILLSFGGKYEEGDSLE